MLNQVAAQFNGTSDDIRQTDSMMLSARGV